KAHGAKKAVLLPVSAPFHCALMEKAAVRLATDLQSLPLRDARVPVVLNVDARPETSAEALRQALIEQVTRPVRWVEIVTRIKDMGADRMVEVGPGRVLSGLAKRIAPGLALLNVEDPASLKACVEGLAKGPGAEA